MSRLIIVSLIFMVFLGCIALNPNPHPELNREFDWRTDTPGEYPYCRNFDKELVLQIQMRGP